MRILLAGSGEPLALLAVRLARKNHQWHDELSRIEPPDDAYSRRSGCRLKENGHCRSADIPLLDPSASLQPADLVICSVPPGQLTETLSRIRGLLAPSTLLVGMQILPADIPVLSGCTCPSAAAAFSGQLRSKAGKGADKETAGTMTMQPLVATESVTTRLNLLIDRLRLAGIGCRLTDNMAPILWRRLAVTSTIDPVCALHGRTRGQLLAMCVVRTVMKRLATETMEVARAGGVELPRDLIAEIFRYCRQQRDLFGSMHHNLCAHGKSGIEHVNGFIVAEGSRLGVPTPTHLQIVKQIGEEEQR